MSKPETKPAAALDLAELHDPLDLGPDAASVSDIGLVRHKAAPTPAIRAARTVMVAGAATFGLFAVATAGFVGASKLLPQAKRGEIQIGGVNLPDLRNGVPPIATAAAPVRTIAGPSVVPAAASLAAAPATPPQPSALTTAMASPALGGPAPLAPAAAGPTSAAGKLPVLLSPKPVGAPQVLAPPRPAVPVVTAAVSEPAPMPPARALPVVRTTASIEPAPALRPAASPDRTGSLSAAPLPPSSPVRTASVEARLVESKPAETKPGPQPNRVAVTPRPKPARREPVLSDPTTTATIEPRKVASEEEHYDWFGLKVPTIGTTANRIKDSVDALGTAVRNLPGG